MSSTTHASDSDLVDLLDGCATSVQQAHVAGCPACRTRLTGLRETWTLVASDGGAEPSPLFWEHLAARIGETVRSEAATDRGWRAWRWAMVAAPVMLVLVALAVTQRPVPSAPTLPGANSVAAAGAGVDGRAALPLVADDDESWEVVALLSESLDSGETDPPVFEPVFGAADRALRHLSPEEQETLARLLAEELGGGPS